MLKTSLFVMVMLVLTLAVISKETVGESNEWNPLAKGLDLGRFPTGRPGYGGDETVVVLRADPDLWSLDLLCASELEKSSNLTSREWCDQFGLTAAINGGMFGKDHRTHVGFCSVRGHENNPGVNEYQSVAAFCAKRPEVPPFKIFDLDEDGVSLENLSKDYACLAQNLRLIKRPREGRWSPQPKRWSESALGEDSQGRILFIFCRTGYSMHDLNEILLALPLDIVCAHHLEGGPEAQMYIKTNDQDMEFVGSYETGFYPWDDNHSPTRVPVVLGLRAKGN